MINFDWRQTDTNSTDCSEVKPPLKRSTMLSIIALTTLASMTVTGCAQTENLAQNQPKQDKEKEEKKDDAHSSAGHSTHYHGGHGSHFSGGAAGQAGTGAQAREQEFGRVKSGARANTNIKTSGYQAPPANAWGGVSRGWFGRFCGSVFGG